MHINDNLSSVPVDNADLFLDPFFRRFSQKPFTVKLTDHIAKTYSFPTFYKDIRLSMAVFLCSYDKAKTMMPHPGMKPVRINRSKSMVVFTCYEYKCVKEMHGFNEVGMSIPVMVNSAARIPLLPVLFSKWFANFGYHIFSMPVTSLENKLRGDQIWGLPKVVQDIEYRNEGGLRICTIKEKTGEPYMTLKVPMNGRQNELQQSVNVFSEKDGQLLKSSACILGAFAQKQYIRQLWKPQKTDGKILEIADTESGRRLKQLEMDEHPFQLRYAEQVRSVFDLPSKVGTYDKF